MPPEADNRDLGGEHYNPSRVELQEELLTSGHNTGRFVARTVVVRPLLCPLDFVKPSFKSWELVFLLCQPLVKNNRKNEELSHKSA